MKKCVITVSYTHLQITLMTREVSDINELEKILDVFQNIKDQEDSRRIQQLDMQNGGNYTPRGGPNGGTTQNGRERDRRYPMWKCDGCLVENYADRNFCYRCRRARPGQQQRTPQRFNNPQQRNGDRRAENLRNEGGNQHMGRVYTPRNADERTGN